MSQSLLYDMVECQCRDEQTQLALLDRIAGTTVKAAAFGACLDTFRQTESQLKAIASLGTEEEREDLQATIQEVRSCSIVDR